MAVITRYRSGSDMLEVYPDLEHTTTEFIYKRHQMLRLSIDYAFRQSMCMLIGYIRGSKAGNEVASS